MQLRKLVCKRCWRPAQVNGLCADCLDEALALTMRISGMFRLVQGVRARRQGGGDHVPPRI